MGFFINVPTWHGEQRALEAFLFQFCTHFYKQRVSMALQHVLVDSILKCVIGIGEVSSRLGIFSRGLLLSLFDMLLETKGGWRI
jgi:hypothetical protein